MRKILTALLLAAMLLSGLAPAQAAPSKTTADMASARLYQIEDEEVPLAGLAVSITANPEAVEAEIASIYTFTVENGAPVIDYFGDDVKSQVAALLPEGLDLNSLVLNELVTVEISNLENALLDGDILVSFTFATTYEDGQNLVVLVGILSDNGETQWIPLEATAQEGVVKVHFTAEALEMAMDALFALAVLSEEEQAKP